MMCHVHPHAEDSWKLSKHVNNGSGVKTHCVACHLPPQSDTWNHYTAKAKLGLKDVWSFMTKDSADFDWNTKSELEHAVKYIPNESCKECHQNLFPEGINQTALPLTFIMTKTKRNWIYSVSAATSTPDTIIRIINTAN